MFKYVITFSKTEIMCYISHLDLMRVFKRAFKKAGIKLAYSQGFNPHPKMGFAQPLSLGYIGLKELMEFETTEDYEPEYLKDALTALMPEGIAIKSCDRLDETKKTLAARTDAAGYVITIPLNKTLAMTGEEIKSSYLGQDRIIALKKQKKKKELAETDRKPMIRSIEFTAKDDSLVIETVLDSGSVSNLSPELLMTTVDKHLGLDMDRSEVEVIRKEIFFH